MFKGAAAGHKRQFERLVDNLGVSIELRFPKARVGDGTLKDKVFGDTGWETVDETTSEPVTVIWSNDYQSFLPNEQAINEMIAMLGRNRDEIDATIRCKLSDVLLDQEKPHGDTKFKKAKEIYFEGSYFEVVDTKRTGLPPLGPYIFWAWLKRIDKE